MTGHDTPMGQAKIQYVGTWSPDLKLTLSTSGVVQHQQAECLNATTGVGFSSQCIGSLAGTGLNAVVPGSHSDLTAWAVDGFAMLDVWGFNLVAYGYTGKGVGTTGLFFDGVDNFGNARDSSGGYFQAAYTFKGWLLPNPLTVGASWGVSHLETAGPTNSLEIANCIASTTAALGAASSCLVRDNQSWIGFARYNLTDWVKLQAEYVHTIAENQIGIEQKDDMFAVGTTFFW
jgi:hypothetical protein